MSRAQMNTNKRRGAAQMHSTPSFTYSAFLHLPQLSGQNLLSYMTDGLFQLPKPLCARHQIPNGRTHIRSFPASSFTVCTIPVRPTISMTALLELLKNADPEVKAQLRLALLT